MSLYFETVIWKVGSHAAWSCEPRQVRKEATVNGKLRVPWERLTGVTVRETPSGWRRREVRGLKVNHSLSGDYSSTL